MTIPNKLEALRSRISELQNERAGLEAQSRTREEVRQRVAVTVRALHEQALKQNARHLMLLADGQHARLLEFTGEDSNALLAALVHGPEALERALLQQIELVPEGVLAAKRAERLAAISDELDAVETQEEALIVQSEETGEPVYRRGDARPEIVLGPRRAPPAQRPRSPFYQGRGEVQAAPRRVALLPTFPSRA
jgi:hypothetical protein